MKIDLSGKHVLVTGASRGIGRAIAQRMIAAGARVAVHYNQSEGAAVEVAGSGSDSIAIDADLADAFACESLVERVRSSLGGLDVLVNNAGIALSSPIEDDAKTWREVWRKTLDVNLVAAAVLSRAAITHFREQGDGRIIFIASRAAFRGDTIDYLAYAASKGGMVALCRSIARGFGKDGVKSFVIAPGFTRTEMAEAFIREYGEELAMKDVALDRLTEPDDIAPMAVLLASGLADHATGTSIDFNAASYVR